MDVLADHTGWLLMSAGVVLLVCAYMAYRFRATLFRQSKKKVEDRRIVY